MTMIHFRFIIAPKRAITAYLPVKREPVNHHGFSTSMALLFPDHRGSHGPLVGNGLCARGFVVPGIVLCRMGHAHEIYDDYYCTNQSLWQ